MRFLLWLSVVLNLLLLTTIVTARVDPAHDGLTDYFGSDRLPRLDSRSHRLPDIGEIHDLFEVLQQTTLSAEDIKTLTLGWLRARYHDTAEMRDSGYWQPDFSPVFADLSQRVAIGQAVREALITVFGPDAAGDSVFDSAFRPLGPAYAFLSSEAQLNLQRHQLELLKARDPTGRTASVQGVSCRVHDTTNSGERLTPSVLPAGLGTSAETEYRLRFSPVSQQLRESAVVDNEHEFRVLFDLLQQLEQKSSPIVQAQIRADLRTLMGDADFDRFWSLRDPFYRPIKEYLEREGSALHQVQTAYSIVNQSQEALLLILGQQADQDLMLMTVAQVRQDETARLTQLLGEEVAAGLAIATSRAAMALSLQGGRNNAC